MESKKSASADLSSNFWGYFLIGLAFALFISWRSLEYQGDYNVDAASNDQSYEEMMGTEILDNIEPPPPPPPPAEEEPPPPPPDTSEIEIVEDNASQTTITTITENRTPTPPPPPPPPPKEEKKTIERKKPVQFQKIESKPIYPGCEKVSNDKQLDCFSQKIDKLLIRYADDVASANEEGLTGNIIVQLNIDENGRITPQVVRGLQGSVDKEIEKILSKAEKVQPGKQRNEAVPVTLMKPIRITN